MAEYSLVPTDTLIFIQGATFLRGYVVKDEDGVVVNLSGAAARGQFRNDYRASSILATQTVTVTDPLNGKVLAQVDAIDTADVDSPEFRGDIELEFPSGFVIRAVNQKLTNDFEVTR